MKYFLVFYVVAYVFVPGTCLPENCRFEDFDMTPNPDGLVVRCYNAKHLLHFIPPITKFIIRIEMYKQNIEQLPYDAFQNISSQYNVSYVMLEKCKIRHIDADAFLNLHNLTFLSLDFNDIKYLDSKTFQHVTKVWYISMYKNQIELLPKGLFENLPLLQSVFLSYNQIRHIEADTFRNTPLLTLIDLDWNKLQHLDVSIKDSISNDTYLYLEDNPLSCDCNLIDLYDLIMGRPQYSVFICENPPTLRDIEWTDLTRDQFTCDPRIEILLNETKEIPVGRNVSLPCVVYSHDKPVITWRKGSTIIASDYLSSSSYKTKHYLNYTFDFEETDAGVYYCSTEFADGQWEAKITLIGDSRPRNQEEITSTVYNGTRYQQVDTGIPQPFSIPNWILYTIIFLVLVGVTAVIIGIVFVVRYTLAKPNIKRNVWLPTVAKRRLFRRPNTGNLISMRVVQSSAMSENSDSESSTNEQPTLTQHYKILEATRN